MKKLAVSVVLIAGTAIWMFGRAPLQASGILPYEDAEAVAAGAQLYAENCASCHGAQLEGQENWRQAGADGKVPAPPHDETGHTWHHPDRQLFLITKYGTEALVGGTYKSDMIGFEDSLTDAQVLQILAFIKSRWPDHVIARHNEISAAAGN